MNKRTKGSIGVWLLLAAGVAVFALGWYAALRSVPQTGGAEIYPTQLSDTLNTFREEVNSTTANINTELETVSGTVNGFGTIATLNIPLLVADGGTGTSTLPTNAQFLSASGSTPTWKTVTFGSGLNSTTTPTSVMISTQGIDPTENYPWSGNNTHAGSETFNGPVVISNATDSILSANSSGTIIGIGSAATTGTILAFNNGVWTTGLPISFSNTSTTVASGTTANVSTTTLPLASPDSNYEIFISSYQSNGIKGTSTITLASTTLDTCYISAGGNSAGYYFNLYAKVQMLNSTSAEEIFATFSGLGCGVTSTVLFATSTLSTQSYLNISEAAGSGALASYPFNVTSSVLMEK